MEKKSTTKLSGRNYLMVMLAIGGVGYLALSVIWLTGRGIPLLTAILVGVTTLVTFTTIAVLINNITIKNAEKQKPDSNSSDTSKTGEGDETDQKELRRRTRVEALKRDTRATRDKVLRDGAVISVLLVAFTVGMAMFFGLSPEEVFFVTWPILGLIWFIQLALFPSWLTYTSLFSMIAIRVGIQFFGLGILQFLPNFIMLPVFYLLMMFFMYGSIMLPSLAQVKKNRPGHGDWGVPRGATRGQPRARAVFDSVFDRIEAYVEGRTNLRPPRGILASGGPGTGKTLLAKEKASWMKFPFVQADGNVFNPPFMGFAPIMKMIVQAQVEALAREYGYCVVFIDECETLFGLRDAGMMRGQGSVGWLDFSDFNIEGNDLVFKRQSVGPTEHDMFLPGAMGGNAGIYGFLTWMDGVPSPPFLSKLVRGIINGLLSVFLPVEAFGQILRLAPAKASVSNVLFIGATNRPWMIDPAIKRPGRLEEEAKFEEMDEMGRFDVAQYYIKMLHSQGHYQDELLNPELIWAFARATPGLSPAEVEGAIREAVVVRAAHLANLRRVKKLANEGAFKTETLASLSENERRQREMDQKFWKRYASEIQDSEGREIPEGWDERVNWDALTESLSKISWGVLRLEALHPETQKKVSYHEVGHFFILTALLVRHFRTVPTVLTALPRGDQALGKVVYMPSDPREMHPQSYYEGAMRVGIGSWVIERLLFGQNMPGVSGDLRTTTGLAALELGRFGMPPLQCTDEGQRKRYQKIGYQLISVPETSFLNPSANSLVEKTLSGRRDDIALMLGMAAVDNYRLFRANKALYASIVAELIQSDEISGKRLEELQEIILKEHIGLDRMGKEDRSAWPPNDFEVSNPFYGEIEAEGRDIVVMVEAALTGGES